MGPPGHRPPAEHAAGAVGEHVADRWIAARDRALQQLQGEADCEREADDASEPEPVEPEGGPEGKEQGDVEDHVHRPERAAEQAPERGLRHGFRLIGQRDQRGGCNREKAGDDQQGAAPAGHSHALK